MAFAQGTSEGLYEWAKEKYNEKAERFSAERNVYMKKEQLICRGCGNGCFLEAVHDGDTLIELAGNQCDGGRRYAGEQLLRDYLKTTLPTSDGREVQVTSREKVSQAVRLRCLRALEGIVLETPVIKGEMVLCDAADSGVDIVAAENLF